MSSNAYDVIVVGLGAMGSATTYQLAKRGRRVLGLDLFDPGHDQGASHGYHRMIRMSSTQDNGYVPLAERAFALWDDLARESGRTMLRLIGEVRLVDSGTNPGFAAVAEKMQRQGFWEVLDAPALAERFPGFQLHDGLIATYEAQAGFLQCEGGILAHLDVAARRGATIHGGEEVVGWVADGAGVKVETNRATYTADQVVITTGPWAAELLKDLNFPLRVIRTVNGFFAPTRPDRWTAEQGAPDFLLDVSEGSFYGMPAVDGVGVKIGRSRLLDGPATTARTIRRTIDESEIALLRDVLDKYQPGSSGPELRRMTCLEAYTADDDFIIDHHPDHRQVLIGCGFSGRGFKFSPTVGEILADLAIDGATRHDITFLSARRFSAAAG